MIMTGKIMGFVIWGVMGCLIIGFAIYGFFSKKPMRFWANAEAFEINDLKKYNHAVAKLFFIFGLVVILLGIPLLSGQNSAWILFSVLGLMAASIILMAIYSLVIEKKYKKGK